MDNAGHRWFLENNVDYEIVYMFPKESYKYGYYHIEIKDRDSAVLYKLTFGGK
jgi:hypothetical protein